MRPDQRSAAASELSGQLRSVRAARHVRLLDVHQPAVQRRPLTPLGVLTKEAALGAASFRVALADIGQARTKRSIPSAQPSPSLVRVVTPLAARFTSSGEFAIAIGRPAPANMSRALFISPSTAISLRSSPSRAPSTSTIRPLLMPGAMTSQ